MRARRRGALLAVAVVATTLVAAPALPQAGDEASTAFDRVSQCVADEGRLSLLALVDESASLRSTDPDDRRTTALEAVVRNLGSLTATSGGDVAVDLQLATFATDFSTIRSWGALTPDTLSSILQDVRGFAERDGGVDTDFANALDGVLAAFDGLAQSEDGAGATCRVLLTFTDGEYDLEPRNRTTSYAPDLPLNEPGNAERVEELGRQAVCQPNGLADSLHEKGVVTVTVGLNPSIDPEDQSFLASLSEGSGDCGQTEGEGLGAYVGADDLDGLLFAFNRASTAFLGGSVASDEQIEPCQVDACPTGTTTFELDPSLRQFHALVTAPDPLVIQLTGPDGRSEMIDPRSDGSVQTSGADLSWIALAGALVIDGQLDPSDDSWVGEWQVTFIDPTGEASDLLARAQITLFGSLSPQFVDLEDARLGEQFEVTVVMADTEGTPRTPRDLLAATDVNVVMTNSATGEELPVEMGPPDGEGRWRATTDLPSDLESAGLEVSASLAVTTVGGIQLPERRTTTVVNVLPPASFPRVEPPVLTFDPVVGQETQSASLQVIGGENAGCVWVEVGSPTVDRDIGNVALRTDSPATTADDCLRVEAGEETSLQFDLTRDGSASGRMQHPIAVHLLSDASSEELTQELLVEAEFVRTVDQAQRLWIFVLVFALGLLLPLAFLYLLNRWTARFREPAFVRYARTPVRVNEDGIERRQPDGATQRFDLDSTDLKSVGAELGDLARLDVGEVRLRPHVPLWPLRPPRGRAAVAGHDVCGSKGFRTTRDGRVEGELGFALPSSWVFVRSEATDDHVDGELYSLVNDGTPFAEVREAHLANLQGSVPAVVMSMPVHEQPSEESEAPVDPDGWVPPPGSTGDGPAPSWRPPTGDDGPPSPPPSFPSGSGPPSPPPPPGERQATQDERSRSAAESPPDDQHSWRPPPD